MAHVERNPVGRKALPIRKAQRRVWSSAGTPPRGVNKPPPDPSPMPRSRDWPAWVNQPLAVSELPALCESVVRGRPFGVAPWRERTARRLGLVYPPLPQPPQAEK